MDKVQGNYAEAGQGHVFRFLPKLTESQRSVLIHQAGSIDIARVNRIYARAIQAEKALSDPQTEEGAIEALPEESFDSTVNAPASKVAAWRHAGLEAISKGQVGVLLMAGGQGTRLGSTAPKGCYDVGLPSHKSLFQYQGERIKRLQVVAGEYSRKEVVIPWYVMTSGPTRSDTVAFFEANKYFGLDPKNVIFFEQGELHSCSGDRSLIGSTDRDASLPNK